ncbi:MAG: class I SAM-dependent RNA methyltransferase [Myxococcales bacterium]|nr:class I SAM-dependent RNA methyltransferase [Myxococcales bacterium]
MSATGERVAIHGVAHGGEGVGKAEAEPRTWLVEAALPGEVVLAERVEARARMIRGRVLRVIEASAARQDAPCAIAGACGGCGWQHVRPAAQAELKRDIVAGLLRRFAVPAIAVVASPEALGYRRRARMRFERTDAGLIMGFVGRDGRSVIDAPDCPVLDGPLRHAFARVRGLAALLPAHGEVHAISDGARAVVGVASRAEAHGHVVPLPPLRGGAEAISRALDEVLVGVVGPGIAVGTTALGVDAAGPEDMSVRTGPFAFAQAQAAQNAAMVEHVARQAGAGHRRGLELFAGSGNFTRRLAPLCKVLTAVELDAGGAANLQTLAARLAVRGCRIEVRREAAAATLARGGSYDLVVLDPPRGGLGSKAARDLARVAAGRVVYVSCDPATLARDLADLVTAGRSVVDVTVFDMMPMTPEVEVVVTLAAEQSRC